ncbi:glycerophosphodiester phosphodiesterase [Haliea sp. E17]|uniref:glycerophosphodiester phosphodiesterase n=1 Tax=Haliea sp. E17 TaxID=3401576 RepID=UPI003AAF1ECF
MPVPRWLLALALLAVSTGIHSGPLVIAHRGASGYLPEHSLEAKALAHAMGADFLEQDVVLSRDGVPVILHDIHLESTTDVEQRFPQRAREDGRFYALDFDLAELRSLRLHERSHRDADGRERAYYPGRFPLGQGSFRLPTLREEIELIDGLNRSTGRPAGLYIELKSPNWHTAQGYDIATAVIAVLEETGYADRSQQVFLQCFDDLTLRRLREEFRTPLPLIQLIGENSWGEDSKVDYSWLQTDAGLAYIAGYADGIGPWIPQVVAVHDDGLLTPTGLAARAHQHDLQVHPYTLRADDLPAGVSDLGSLHRALFTEAGVDGLFSDFPDLTVAFLRGAAQQ